jgi:AraC-like DNA-binding protein
MSWTSGRDEIDFLPGGVARFPIAARLQANIPELGIAVLRLPMVEVERFAEAHTGTAAAQLRFGDLGPRSESAARQWRSLASYVHGNLAANASLESPLVMAQLIDIVAATALTVFPNTAMYVTEAPGPGRVTPAALRRAITYIDTYAHQPITLADIAAAAGTTGRAVQSAFRRHRDTTPTQYMRRVRLDGAHRDLRSADPSRGDTVAAIAARWGFSPATRFNNVYREQFGVLPSQTLRNREA